MRDPATTVDPEVETAIEETRRFFEGSSWLYWEADPDNELVSPLRAEIRKVEALDMPDQIKNLAVWMLFEEETPAQAKAQVS